MNETILLIGLLVVEAVWLAVRAWSIHDHGARLQRLEDTVGRMAAGERIKADFEAARKRMADPLSVAEPSPLGGPLRRKPRPILVMEPPDDRPHRPGEYRVIGSRGVPRMSEPESECGRTKTYKSPGRAASGAELKE